MLRFRRAPTRLLLLPALALLPAAPAAADPGPPEVVAGGLAAPWEVVLLPDGRTLVTERPGRIRVIGPDGVLQPAPVFTHGGGGVTVKKFLGLEPHPGYERNRLLYLYETYTRDGAARSRIVRLRDQGAQLVFERTIFDGIGSDLNHDGGRMKFGPDGKLYVTTGDIHNPATPQDLMSLNGKILRLEVPGDDRDGTAAEGNPFTARGGNARFVWSYGHRHPQGITWGADGRMWESEHGPSGETHAPAGARCCRDEVNLIKPGGNYGWPLVAGAMTRPGTIAPAAHSGDDTWAPGGAAVASDGALYVPMLRGERLGRFVLDGDAVTSQTPLLAGTFGRLRTATFGRDALWVTTDDGRILRLGVGAARRAAPGIAAPIGPAENPVPDVAAPVGPAENAAPGSTPPPALPAPPADPSSHSGSDGDSRPGTAPSTPATRRRVVARRRGDALDRLLASARTALRPRGLRGLLRSPAVRTDAPGFGEGRVVLRVERRRTGGARRVTLAVGSTRSRARARVRIALRTTRAGRIALRRRSKLAVVIRATFVAPNGTRTQRTRRLVLRAASA